MLRRIGKASFQYGVHEKGALMGFVTTNIVFMRFGLEQPRFLERKRGCVWTNLPDYGKIPT